MFSLARKQLSNDEIARRASSLRNETGIGDIEYFNIVDFVQGPLRTWLLARGRGKLTIDLRHSEDEADLPRVELSKLILHSSPERWFEAGIAEPLARYEVGHEIGHLALHNYFDFNFSPDEVTAPGILTPTIEAEANRFAHEFLVPKSIALSIADPSAIARRCSVPIEVADEQFGGVARIARPIDFCGCGQITSGRDANGNPLCVDCAKRLSSRTSWD